MIIRALIPRAANKPPDQKKEPPPALDQAQLSVARAALQPFEEVPFPATMRKKLQEAAEKAVADGHQPTLDESLTWVWHVYWGNSHDDYHGKVWDSMFHLVEAGKVPADSRAGQWMALAQRWQQTMPAWSKDGIRHHVFDAITRERWRGNGEPDVGGVASALTQVAWRAGTDTCNQILQELRLADAKHDGRFAPYFEAVQRNLEAQPDARRQKMAQEAAVVGAHHPFNALAIWRTTGLPADTPQGTPDPGDVYCRLAQMGTSLMRKETAREGQKPPPDFGPEDARFQIGRKVLDEMIRHANECGHSDVAEWVQTVATFVDSLHGNDRVILLRDAFNKLERAPLNIKEFAEMGSGLCYSDVPYADKNALSLALIESMRRMEARSPDPALRAKLDLLSSIKLTQDPGTGCMSKTPVSYYASGFTHLREAPTPFNSVARYAESLPEALRNYYLDKEQFGADTLRVLSRFANESGDQAASNLLKFAGDLRGDDLLPAHIKDSALQTCVKILGHEAPVPPQIPFDMAANWLRYDIAASHKSRILQLLLPAMRHLDSSLAKPSSDQVQFLGDLCSVSVEKKPFVYYKPEFVREALTNVLSGRYTDTTQDKARLALSLMSATLHETDKMRAGFGYHANRLLCTPTTAGAAAAALHRVCENHQQSDEEQLQVLRALANGIPTHPIEFAHTILGLARTDPLHTEVMGDLLTALPAVAEAHGDNEYLPQLARDGLQRLQSALDPGARQAAAQETEEELKRIGEIYDKLVQGQAIFQKMLGAGSDGPGIAQADNHVMIGGLRVPRKTLNKEEP